MARSGARTAVVLFNLGGPDSPKAVRPFLFNLFSDPAMIRLPGPLRFIFATLISRLRARKAAEIYARIGGRSPIHEETEAQAAALTKLIASPDTKVFIAMRYWHPFAWEIMEEVADFAPDQIILLPLYPQFSTTTTGSSVADWENTMRRLRLETEVRTLCCYPEEGAFIEAHADQIKTALAEAREAAPDTPLRLLLSAHGLPEKIVDAGDPYAWQIEQTAAAIAKAVGEPDLDWQVCYQSRVGPMKWIGPATSEELKRAGKNGCAVVIAPIAFVSEHSETLVELDIEYRELAEHEGVPAYIRVPALGSHAKFIRALKTLIEAASAAPTSGACSATGQRICPAKYGACPMTPDAGSRPGFRKEAA